MYKVLSIYVNNNINKSRDNTHLLQDVTGQTEFWNLEEEIHLKR